MMASTAATTSGSKRPSEGPASDKTIPTGNGLLPDDIDLLNREVGAPIGWRRERDPDKLTDKIRKGITARSDACRVPPA